MKHYTVLKFIQFLDICTVLRDIYNVKRADLLIDVKRYKLYKEIYTVLREKKIFEHCKIEMYSIHVCFAIFSLITTKIVLLKIYRGLTCWISFVDIQFYV